MNCYYPKKLQLTSEKLAIMESIHTVSLLCSQIELQLSAVLLVILAK